MKNQFLILVAVVLAVVLLSFMVFYQVQYNQVVVLSTFGKVTPESVKNTPGIRWRVPVIQTKYTYSKRLNILEDELQQFQTADRKSVVVRLYLDWQITDAYQFTKADLRDARRAETFLRPLLLEQRRVLSKYNFDDLVNTDPSKIKLAEIEDDMLKTFRAQLEPNQWGITAQHVGIRRLVLDRAVTGKVFERMKNERQRMAADIEADGRATAQQISAEAESMKTRILTFANKRAQEIRTEGDTKSAPYYVEFAADEQFANFLRRIETLKIILANNTTFVVDVNQLSEFNLFSNTPTPMQKAAGSQP